ncbi:TPA: hypothetical protein LLC85_002408, partial [Enterococcus faecium]|nr:hypothetical protein [Enterococcus faecium]
MLKNTIQWLKNHLGLFKTIFLISVIVIIVGELMSIGKTLSIQQLGETFATIPVWKSGLMLLIGLISVLPMVGYDIILNRMLEQKQNPRYLFETSWLINTINNIAGFGGFVSVGLRSELYGQKKESRNVIQALSKVFLFLMAGLSIYSLLSFLLVVFTPVAPFLKQYWIWLIGGGLYFPVVFLFTTFKKKGFLGGTSLKTQGQLLLV